MGSALENGEALVEGQSNSQETYLAKYRMEAEITAWGLFFFPSMFPLILLLELVVESIPLIVFMSSFVGFYGISKLLNRLSSRAGIGLWIDPKTLDILERVEQSTLCTLSGFISFSFLYSLSIFWIGTIWTSASMSEIWEVIFPYVIIGLALIPLLPIIHFTVSFLKRRQKDERVRRKMVLLRKQDLEKCVFNALNSMGLKSEELVEGSKWMGPIRSHKVKDHDISMRMFQGGAKSAIVVTTTRTPEDYRMAERIERSIDSFIVT
jgi:hypothetical protein